MVRFYLWFPACIVLSVSEPELLYSGSHVSADRPTVRLQPGSISQLLTVFSDLSHIIN